MKYEKKKEKKRGGICKTDALFQNLILKKEGLYLR